MILLKNIILSFKQLVTLSWFLKLSGVAYVLLSFVFILVTNVWDFYVIDEMYTEEVILAHLNTMTETQKHVHTLTTATLDVIYPFVYGFFQAVWRGVIWAPWGSGLLP